MTEQLAREVRDFWLDPGRLTRSAQQSAQLVRERFGRFPRRNRVLGRITTPEEHAWLTGTHLPPQPPG